MFQAHSLLWHYLWVAPNLLLFLLAYYLWHGNLHRRYPSFFAFALLAALDQLTIYVCDLLPSVSAPTWWHVFWAGLVVEGVLKFVLIGEIFAHAFQSYDAIAKLGKRLIGGVGATLIFASAVAAAYAPKDSLFGIISGAHLLQQTIYIVECGLLLFIFLFSAYFRVRMPSLDFGIALGLGISACVHLATWASTSNAGLAVDQRVLLDFVNMGTYHVCVLIWFYYVLVPHRAPEVSPIVTLPESNLDLWNRELERLIHQ